MEVIRGRERDCRQEIRGQARRGGTRSTQRVDSQRQAFRPAADEGAHPVEGGHIGCGRWLERQPDRRGRRTATAVIEACADNPFSGLEEYRLGTHHTWTEAEIAQFERRW